MKSPILIAAIVAFALSAPFASAREGTAPLKPAMGMDMEKPMSEMRENMKKMQQQMEKLMATTDPQERERLMHEHMQTMQERQKMMHAHMHAMHGMGGPMMGMTGAKHGDSMKNAAPTQPDEFIRLRTEPM